MSSEFQLAKEKALEDLRKIREELLQRERSSDQKQTTKAPKGEPLLKLKSSENKEKHKKNRDKRHKKHKKSDKDKHKHEEKKHSNSSSSEEKESTPRKRSCSPEVAARDDWMTASVLLKTFSKNKPQPKKQCTDTYEPGKSSRELNPHWKDGGTGLPSFRKPKDDYDDNYDSKLKYSYKSSKSTSDGWQKQTESKAPDIDDQTERPSSSSISKKESTPEFMTDQQMNELGAKIMKAELLNNNDLADELKNKLKSARLMREQNMGHAKDGNKLKNKTHRRPHSDMSRVRRAQSSAADDYDEQHLKNKFEREKSSHRNSAKDDEDHKHFNEDFDDIFGNTKPGDLDSDKLREIRNKNRPSKKLNNCDKCFNSEKMNKELVVSVGKHVYLALPWHEGLQTNHCLIIPIDHYSSSTQLDEDVWQEISTYRRVLTKLFAKRKQDVLFFETARYLQKRPHMIIHCLPSSSFEMAPFYFKKAIEESEYEWSKNKQLVTLKDKNLRKSIPCGLPYFWVNFGMDFGFAHVIENQENFPSHFAQEIIGGMLTLDMRKWRSPRQEQNVKTKVKNLVDLLKPYEAEVSCD